ncbi:MAG: alpha/beta hydrolase [Promethearchaeota archaeon]|nr:MAG: alpha/beta hydrolase [Candidatus Lokiarchaeota archaeon]
MTDLFAEVNGIKICYDVHGEGEPLVLIHGFSDRKEHWLAQVGELSKHFKVIRMDNRGAGKSDRPNGEYSMKVYAQDIAGLLDFLEIDKTNIAGHSLGGMIVQNFLIYYPERVKKAILINTIPGLTPPGVPNEQGIKMYQENSINNLKKIQEDPLNEFLDGAKRNYSRKFYKEMVNNPDKKFHGIWSAKDLVKEKTEYGPTEKDIIHQAEALSTHNVYEKLPNVEIEVLVLAAEKDKTCPKIMNEKIHELLPNSKMEVIKNAGHQSILEFAPEVNKYIIDFLKS